jgi:hypothetical protein
LLKSLVITISLTFYIYYIIIYNIFQIDVYFGQKLIYTHYHFLDNNRENNERGRLSMYSQMMSGEKITPYLVRLLVDTEDEIATLPTHFTPGSTCEVVATSSTYRLNNQGQWIKQKSSGGGGGGTVVVEGSLADIADIDKLFG